MTLRQMVNAAKVAARQAVMPLLSTSAVDLVLWPVHQRKIQNYFRSHEVRKVQLGCGANLLEGWLNSDFIPTPRKYMGGVPYLRIDCSKTLPFEDSSLDYVYSEHMHEHLPYNVGLALLKEIRRVLKPGGKVRVALPDMNFYAEMMSASDPSALHRELLTTFWSMFGEEVRQTDGLADAPGSGSTAVNYLFRGSDHKYLYSRADLRRQLELAGFSDVGVFSPGESSDPVLRGLENGRDVPDHAMKLHLAYTIAVEGTHVG